MPASPEQELADLQALYPTAELMWEGGEPYVYFPALTIVANGKTVTTAALLAPHLHSGYATRLFLDKKIDTEVGAELNWQIQTVMNRTWNTWSWSEVSADQPWTSILSNHIRAFK